MAQSRSRDNVEKVRQLRVGKYVVGKLYLEGDIVTLENNMYIALQDNSSTPALLATVLDWKIMDRGGIIWNDYTQYQIGDIVSYSGDIYVVGEDPLNPGFPPPTGTTPGDVSGTWPITGPNTPIKPERGGIIWETGVSYLKGDTVTDDRDVYVANQDHVAGLSFATDTSKWDGSLSQSSVISEDGAGGHAGSKRISTMISISQIEYDSIASKEVDCLYIIV